MDINRHQDRRWYSYQCCFSNFISTTSSSGVSEHIQLEGIRGGEDHLPFRIHRHYSRNPDNRTRNHSMSPVACQKHFRPHHLVPSPSLYRHVLCRAHGRLCWHLSAVAVGQRCTLELGIQYWS
jgi:hypothetical protein